MFRWASQGKSQKRGAERGAFHLGKLVRTGTAAGEDESLAFTVLSFFFSSSAWKRKFLVRDERPEASNDGHAFISRH